MTDTEGLNTKVAGVLTNLGVQLTRLGTIIDELTAIGGPDNVSLGDLNSNLAALRASSGDISSTLDDRLTAMLDTLGVKPPLNEQTMWSMLLDTTARLESIYNSLGVVPGDATTTVLGRLAAIERLSHCACGPQPPDPADEHGCADPAVSDSSAAPDGYSGRIFAGWSTPPDGALIGTTLDPTVGAAELVPEATFEGWRAYVLSRASAVASLDPRENIVFGTNQWLDISSRTLIAASVPPNSDIALYLCPFVPEAWVDCVEVFSAHTTVTHPDSATNEITYAQMSQIPSAELSSDLFVDGSAHYHADVPDWVMVGNFAGVTVQLTSAIGGVRVVWQRPDLSFGTSTMGTTGDTVTIPEATIGMTVDTFTGGAIPDFTVSICPSGGD